MTYNNFFAKQANTPPESSETPLYKGNLTIEHPT